MRVEVAADDPRRRRAARACRARRASRASGRSSASAAKRPGQRPTSFSVSSQRAATCSKSYGSSVPWRPMSPVGSSTRGDAELVHARRPTSLGLGEAVAGVAPHLHLRRRSPRSRRPTPRPVGRERVAQVVDDAVMRVPVIAEPLQLRATRRPRSSASSAPGATTSAAMRTPSRSLSRCLDRVRDRRVRRRVARRSPPRRSSRRGCRRAPRARTSRASTPSTAHRDRRRPPSGHTLTPRSFTMLSPRPANGAILRSQLPHAHCSRGTGRTGP